MVLIPILQLFHNFLPTGGLRVVVGYFSNILPHLFNRVLGTLLLGGLYTEAVHPMDISYGMLHFEGYLKIHGGGNGGTAKFHRAIRTKSVGIDEAIDLLEPIIITKDFLENAYKTGTNFFKTLEGFSPNLC